MPLDFLNGKTPKFAAKQVSCYQRFIAIGRFRQLGVIQLRLPDAKPERVAKVILNILPHIEEAIIAGAIISVELSNFRIRYLPISTLKVVSSKSGTKNKS